MHMIMLHLNMLVCFHTSSSTIHTAPPFSPLLLPTPFFLYTLPLSSIFPPGSFFAALTITPSQRSNQAQNILQSSKHGNKTFNTATHTI
ncbi:hypothetical protein J3F83DRAFT_726552 [Trichoderma novae-zelandiae]